LRRERVRDADMIARDHAHNDRSAAGNLLDGATI
jgi:hypothetical protein